MIIGRLAKINAEHYYLFRTLSDAHTYHIYNVLNPFLSPTKKRTANLPRHSLLKNQWFFLVFEVIIRQLPEKHRYILYGSIGLI